MDQPYGAQDSGAKCPLTHRSEGPGPAPDPLQSVFASPFFGVAGHSPPWNSHHCGARRGHCRGTTPYNNQKATRHSTRMTRIRPPGWSSQMALIAPDQLSWQHIREVRKLPPRSRRSSGGAMWRWYRSVTRKPTGSHNRGTGYEHLSTAPVLRPAKGRSAPCRSNLALSQLPFCGCPMVNEGSVRPGVMRGAMRSCRRSVTTVQQRNTISGCPWHTRLRKSRLSVKQDPKSLLIVSNCSRNTYPGEGPPKGMCRNSSNHSESPRTLARGILTKCGVNQAQGLL